MTPFYADEWLTILEGDCRVVLPSLPADSVDCVVTSPPYWGLRDYGHDGQLGLERTPEEYVANMVAVFAEVRRVLKPSGTCWLNLGDSYGGGNGGDTRSGFNARYRNDTGNDKPWQATDKQSATASQLPDRPKVKPKDLVGIPWRVAFALQADGWYLRSDIIWSKPNPMPESVTDRPTKAHEYLFLLTKSARYYFDADAVREVGSLTSHGGGQAHDGRSASILKGTARNNGNSGTLNAQPAGEAGRNIRSVWTIATRPYPGAHFAVFPPELPERCIKAGSSERGVCPECGAPWERVVERTNESTYARIQREHGITYKDMKAEAAANGVTPGNVGGTHAPGRRGAFYESPGNVTTGWRPSCTPGRCPAADRPSGEWLTMDASPAVILDPFAGSGTVGMVANRLSRRAILIDLNPEYLRQQMTRNAQTPLGLGAA